MHFTNSNAPKRTMILLYLVLLSALVPVLVPLATTKPRLLDKESLALWFCPLRSDHNRHI